jgi:polygalacturonase
MGLRIKTRRGRGKDAILDEIAFRRIDMDNVMTPFCINAFYFCDPDGKTDYVQSRSLMEVDDRTPVLKRFVFEDIKAENCHVAATYFDGLPEKKIEEVVFRNVEVTYSDDPTPERPIMSSGVEACTLKGFFVRNVKRLVAENVKVSGQQGEKAVFEGIDEIVGEVD